MKKKIFFAMFSLCFVALFTMSLTNAFAAQSSNKQTLAVISASSYKVENETETQLTTDTLYAVIDNKDGTSEHTITPLNAKLTESGKIKYSYSIMNIFGSAIGYSVLINSTFYDNMNFFYSINGSEKTQLEDMIFGEVQNEICNIDLYIEIADLREDAFFEGNLQLVLSEVGG